MNVLMHVYAYLSSLAQAAGLLDRRYRHQPDQPDTLRHKQQPLQQVSKKAVHLAARRCAARRP